MVVSQEKKSEASRRRWLYGVAAAAAGLGGVGFAWWKFTPQPVDPSGVDALWSQSFETPAGGRLAMQGLRGRPLLINFWATWCPPCVEELSLLDSFFKENAANGWQVLGLAVDKVDLVRQFLVRQPLAFPVAMAGMEGVSLSKLLGNVSGSLPFSILIGADGVIRQRKLGKLSPSDLALWRELK